MREENKMKAVATLPNYSYSCPEGKKMLEDYGFTVVENQLGKPLTQEEVWELAYDADAIVAGVDIWNEASFQHCPKVKIVARFGVGFDNFDLEAGKRYGVKMCNAKGINSPAVAEYTINLMLDISRKTCNFNNSVRTGLWDRSPGFLGHNIGDKKVGLVGFGDIAQKVAKILTGFGSQVYASDPYPNLEAAKTLGVKITDFNNIIESCDIISIHVPSIPETKHLFHAGIFKKMKNSAILINTARGPIVNQTDLYTALLNKEIAGAGIDVYEQEPTTAQNPLFQLSNIVVSPHIAAETYETYRDVGIATAQIIIDVMQGRQPKNLLNP